MRLFGNRIQWAISVLHRKPNEMLVESTGWGGHQTILHLTNHWKPMGVQTPPDSPGQVYIWFEKQSFWRRQKTWEITYEIHDWNGQQIVLHPFNGHKLFKADWEGFGVSQETPEKVRVWLRRVASKK